MAAKKTVSLTVLEQRKRDLEDQIARERTALAEKFGKPFVAQLGDTVSVQQLTSLAKLIKAKGIDTVLAAAK